MIDDIINIAMSAGSAIMDIYNSKKNIKINFKKDKSPITMADIIANKIIISGLKKLTPNFSLISEENLSQWCIRKNWKKYWLIDPLDGTKEFIKHNGQFTINIAFIENGKPIIGVIYAPAINVLYATINGNVWCIDSKR